MKILVPKHLQGRAETSGLESWNNPWGPRMRAPEGAGQWRSPAGCSNGTGAYGGLYAGEITPVPPVVLWSSAGEVDSLCWLYCQQVPLEVMPGLL